MSIVRVENGSDGRFEGRAACAVRAAEAQGAIVRSSWRFELVAALLVAVGALFALVPAQAMASPDTSVEAKGTEAKGSPITLSEVAIHEAASSKLDNIPALLRQDVETELAAIDWTKLGLRRRYKLSASVVRLESSRTGERNITASCTVSAALRDAERGTLLVIVEGRAHAEDAPAAAQSAERDALAGAVRGAITAVPEAIRRSQ